MACNPRHRQVEKNSSFHVLVLSEVRYKESQTWNAKMITRIHIGRRIYVTAVCFAPPVSHARLRQCPKYPINASLSVSLSVSSHHS